MQPEAVVLAAVIAAEPCSGLDQRVHDFECGAVQGAASGERRRPRDRACEVSNALALSPRDYNSKALQRRS